MSKSATRFKNAINPPQPEAGFVTRPRLVARLHEFLDRRLILVTAPAGYGKTSLLVDFAQLTDLPVVWTRLSHADQDENRLARLLLASFASHYDQLKQLNDLEALAGRPAEALSNGLIECLDQAVEGPIVLIIDDAHRISDSQASLSVIDRLLKRAPESITFVVAARHSLRLDLIGLTADGRVGGVGEQELALTRAELESVLHQHLDQLPDDRWLEQLHYTTRGWPTGVVLAGHAAQRSGRFDLAKSAQSIQRFMRTTVVEALPQAERDFLQQAAVLPQMSARLCDQLLDRTDSQQQLERIVAHGMFTVRLQTDPPTYELHPLLRETLLQLASTHDAEGLRQLQAVAGQLLARVGRPEEAFALLTVADDRAAAAELAEAQAATLFRSGQISTLEQWVQQLMRWGTSAPTAFLNMAHACADRGQSDQAEAWIAAALKEDDQAELSAIRVTAGSIRARLADKVGDAARLQAHIQARDDLLADSASDFERAVSHRWRAVALLRQHTRLEEAEDHARAAVKLFGLCGDSYLEAQALLDLCAVLDARGRPQEAEAAVERSLEVLPADSQLIPRSTGLNNRAVLLHHAGRFESALEFFNQARRIARRGASPFHEANAVLGQADLFADLGLQLQAADLYDEGIRLSRKIESTRLVHYGYTQTGALHRRSGTPELAESWLDRASELSGETDAVQLGRIGVHASTAPDLALKEIEVQRSRNGALTRSQNTWLDYFCAQAARRQGQTDERLIHTYLDNAGRRHTEQLLAGELAFDGEARRRLRQVAPTHPTAAAIEQRLRHMRALAMTYGADADVAPPSGLRVAALGKARIYLDGGLIESLAPLPRQVLLYLVDHSVIERDRLLEAFWPNSPHDKQVSNLYTAMHAIRRGIGSDVVDIQGSLYRLDRGRPFAYDVRDFEQSLAGLQVRATGDPERYFLAQFGLRAYGGEFLPAYDSEWVLTRRRQLAADHITLLLLHADEALLHADSEAALASVRAAWQLEPLREDIVLRLLDQLADAGRRAEAANVYRAYVERMRDELGLEPTKALRAAYVRVLNL